MKNNRKANAMRVNDNGDDDASIIPPKNWYSIAETLYLENNGTMVKVRSRINDDSGYTSVDEIVWNQL